MKSQAQSRKVNKSVQKKASTKRAPTKGKGKVGRTKIVYRVRTIPSTSSVDCGTCVTDPEGLLNKFKSSLKFDINFQLLPHGTPLIIKSTNKYNQESFGVIQKRMRYKISLKSNEMKISDEFLNIVPVYNVFSIQLDPELVPVGVELTFMTTLFVGLNPDIHVNLYQYSYEVTQLGPNILSNRAFKPRVIKITGSNSRITRKILFTKGNVNKIKYFHTICKRRQILSPKTVDLFGIEFPEGSYGLMHLNTKLLYQGTLRCLN